MRNGNPISVAWVIVLIAAAPGAGAEEPVFSGPQVGEKVTPFTAVDVVGPSAGEERDLVTENKAAPTVIVFVHGLERSIVPLMTVIDEYGRQKRDALKTAFVFLTTDRIDSEKRLPLVRQSLKMQSPMVLSVDGPEGPGNYGLNKRCLMTVVVARGDVVTANFALVQPGIADAPAVLKAMADACGDREPPDVQALRARRQAEGGGREEMRGRRDAARQGGTDLTKLDLSSEAGLREAVKALIEEVTALRREVTELRRARGSATPPRGARDEQPGAAPRDERR